MQIPEGNVRKSDMLPSGWSDGAGVYSLMYQRTEQSDPATYMLKVISVEGMLLVHLLVSDASVNHFRQIFRIGTVRCAEGCDACADMGQL